MRTNSPVTITGSTIAENQVSDDGGGVYVLGSTMDILDSTVADNLSTSFAGGLWIIGGSNATIRRSTISGNEATAGGGGGIDNTGAQLLLEYSTVSNNYTGGYGGGIYFELDPEDPIVYSQTVRGSTITGNMTPATGIGGGGIWIDTNSTPVIEGSIISGNTDLSGTAPDLYDYLGAASISYSLIGDNYGTTLAESPGDANGNIVGGYVSGVVDAMLTPLQEQWWPHTDARSHGG